MKKNNLSPSWKHTHPQRTRLLTLSMTGLLILSALTACGASGAKQTSYMSETMAVEAAAGSYENAAFSADTAADGSAPSTFSARSLDAGSAQAKSGSADSAGSESASTGKTEESIGTDEISADRKLIRNVDLSFETTDFDTFTKELEQETAKLGGYVESSDLSGNESTSTRRNAYYTLRIPKTQVDSFLRFAEGEANLTRKYESTQDISLQYYDTESRKKALQAEYDRLMELLAKAESVDAVIAIEQRLSEIRYQLDSFESDLRRYDNQVDYSTVTVNVSETTVLSASESSGFWSRVQANLEQNLEDLGNAAIGLLIWFLSSLPILLALGVLLFIAYRIVKAIRTHRKKQKDGKVKEDSDKKTASSEVEPPTSKL